MGGAHQCAPNLDVPPARTRRHPDQEPGRCPRVPYWHPRESAATKLLQKLGFVVNGAQDALGPGLDLAANDETNMNSFITRRFELLVSLDWAAAYNGRNAGLGPQDMQPAWVPMRPRHIGMASTLAPIRKSRDASMPHCSA